MTTYHYLKRSIAGVVTLPAPLDPALYNNTGNDFADYWRNMWLPLTEEQTAFAEANPKATPAEIWACKLTPAPKRTLNQAKAEMVERIETYDVSPAVNSFTLGGRQIWLDKATRVGLANSIAIEAEAGRETTNLWFGGERYSLTISAAKQMLAAVELYALDCYNVTASHKYSVSQLTTIEEVDAYDYRSGYPEHLNLDEL